MQPFEKRYRKIIRAGGLYDVIATLPLALPGVVSMQQSRDFIPYFLAQMLQTTARDLAFNHRQFFNLSNRRVHIFL